MNMIWGFSPKKKNKMRIVETTSIPNLTNKYVLLFINYFL